MKLLTLLLTLLSLPAVAENYVPTQANYTVPVKAPELLPFSNFTVTIDQSYQGPSTQNIAYTFPKELTGEPPLSITMSRVPGSSTLWSGPVVKAECTDLAPVFQCQMNFADGIQPEDVVSLPRVNEFLMGQGKSLIDVQLQLQVVQEFLSSEPIGTLTYTYQ